MQKFYLKLHNEVFSHRSIATFTQVKGMLKTSSTAAQMTLLANMLSSFSPRSHLQVLVFTQGERMRKENAGEGNSRPIVSIRIQDFKLAHGLPGETTN